MKLSLPGIEACLRGANEQRIDLQVLHQPFWRDTRGTPAKYWAPLKRPSKVDVS